MSEIVCDKTMVGGQPTLKGTRLTVHNIVYGVYIDGKDYMTDHELTSEDVMAAITYCTALECENNPYGRFCEHCILDKTWDVEPGDSKVAGWIYAKAILYPPK
ncbi:MAG: DUF433 domain-containing protein [Sphingobacteriales bacterium JAD_PAG50586_3]|nr:MAG: DUF433 domain-containing protein [Sphingobacteriales bacterium JAD_PAG50586_3]